MAERSEYLNLQADRIEMVLSEHRITGYVSGGVLTPRLARFRFRPSLGTRLSKVKALSEEIALSLGAQDCVITRRAGVIEIDVAREGAESVQLLPLCSRLERVPACAPLLGLDGEGYPLVLSLSAPEVSHVLVSGTTGSGKTVLVRSMVASLAMSNPQSLLQMAMIDLKRRGLGVFCGLPHLIWPVAGDAASAIAVLSRVVNEMERRDRERASEPRIVLFIDELAELVMDGGQRSKALLTRLTQRGREAGIHVVACTQKPLSSVIGSLVKSNFPTKVVGKVASAQDALVASGMPGTGAERLGGRGEFIVVAAGQMTRVQGAHVSESEIAKLVSQLRQASGMGPSGSGPRQ
jgi:DNA segregation ATPase FtsK/SpoIIIE, S-DNA-T family